MSVVASLSLDTTVRTVLVLIPTWLVFRAVAQHRKRPSGVPVVPSSWIPLLGSTAEYFGSICQFMRRYGRRYHKQGVFCAQVLGRDWYFLLHKDDVAKALKSSEKAVSFYHALDIFTHSLLPTEAIEGKSLPQDVQNCMARKGPHGKSSTPAFIHSLKRLPQWTTTLQEAFQYNFDHAMQTQGEQEIFDWCKDLISIATAKVLLGSKVDMDIVEEWVRLVNDADIEQALTGGINLQSLQMFYEGNVLGERQAYVRLRKLIYPVVEEAIEQFLQSLDDDKNNNTETNDGALGALIESAYQMVGENPDYLRMFKIRIANDMIFFTFAAITNSYSAAAWSLFHVLRDTQGCGTAVLKGLEKMKQSIASSNNSSGKNANRVSLPEILDNFVLEITRIYTPANVFRYLEKDFPLASNPQIILPKGSMVALSANLTGTNPDIWSENPNYFDPQRFTKPPSGPFFGFGAGAHPCVGKRLAVTEIALFVAQVLQTYDLELVETEYQSNDVTRDNVRNVENHPTLDLSQTNSIWRSTEPIMIWYKRKDK